MNDKTIVVERCEKDPNGYYDCVKRTLMRIKPRFLKVVARNGFFHKIPEFVLNEEGVGFYKDKVKDWCPENVDDYFFNILSKKEINERIKKLEKNIKNEKDTIALLKHSDNINL